MSRTKFTPALCNVYSFSLRDRLRRTRRETLRMTKSKKNNNKPKLNLTVRDEQRNKLERMASLENRSLSNLIEVMADERWKGLTEALGKKDHGKMTWQDVTELYAHMDSDFEDGTLAVLRRAVAAKKDAKKDSTISTEKIKPETTTEV